MRKLIEKIEAENWVEDYPIRVVRDFCKANDFHIAPIRNKRNNRRHKRYGLYKGKYAYDSVKREMVGL